MLTFPDLSALRSFADTLDFTKTPEALDRFQRNGVALDWSGSCMTIHSGVYDHKIVLHPCQPPLYPPYKTLSFIKAKRRHANGLLMEATQQPIHKQVDWIRRDLLRAIDQTARFAVEGLALLRAVVWAAYPDQETEILLQEYNTVIRGIPHSRTRQVANHALNLALKPWPHVVVEETPYGTCKHIHPLLVGAGQSLKIPIPSAHSLLDSMRHAQSPAWWPRYVAKLAGC